MSLLKDVRPRLKIIHGNLRDAAGESLVETLLSTLIIVAVFLMLCTAVVCAAKVNTAIDPADTIFNSSSSSAMEGASVTVKDEGTGDSVTQGIAARVTDNGYIYYE